MRLTFLAWLPVAAGVLYRRPLVPGGRLQLVDIDVPTYEDAEAGLVGGPALHIHAEGPVAPQNSSECLALVPMAEDRGEEEVPEAQADQQQIVVSEQAADTAKHGGRKRKGWEEVATERVEEGQT